MAENNGHDVKIIDGQAENMPIDQLVKQTLSFNPDIIGVTATTPFYHIVVDLAKRLKALRNDIPIAIGGPHLSVVGKPAFLSCFDFGFIGGAENSWIQFLTTYERKEDFSRIKGILYREGGEIRYNGDAVPISDINSIPLPARHLLNQNNYKIGTLQGTKRFSTIMTMRGCPYKCIFCSTKVFGKKIRKRTPEKVVGEISHVVSKYGINHFIILDDTLTIDKDHILEICHILINSKIDITFEGSTRANLVDEEIVSTMARAGLVRLSFGLESVDDGIRKTMRKEVPLESYSVANKLTNKYGIETLNSCMIGLPGETIDTVRKTLAYLRTSREIKQANISIAVPYPGTELYEMARKGENKLKLLTDDFSEFRRYNSAVMAVGDLSPKDLIDLQNEAFVSIYMAPWRWKPMIKKSGIKGFILTFSRLIKVIFKGHFRFMTKKQLGID